MLKKVRVGVWIQQCFKMKFDIKPSAHNDTLVSWAKASGICYTVRLPNYECFTRKLSDKRKYYVRRAAD